jgi:hypothetical protein
MNSKNQVIISRWLGLGLIGFAGAAALPFNDRIEFKIGNRIESRPAWLVPAKAEFKGIERGARWHQNLACSGGMVTVMLIARKEGE